MGGAAWDGQPQEGVGLPEGARALALGGQAAPLLRARGLAHESPVAPNSWHAHPMFFIPDPGPEAYIDAGTPAHPNVTNHPTCTCTWEVGLCIILH